MPEIGFRISFAAADERLTDAKVAIA